MEDNNNQTTQPAPVDQQNLTTPAAPQVVAAETPVVQPAAPMAEPAAPVAEQAPAQPAPTIAVPASPAAPAKKSSKTKFIALGVVVAVLVAVGVYMLFVR